MLTPDATPQAASTTPARSVFAEAAAQIKAQFLRKERLLFNVSLFLLLISWGTFRGIRQFTQEGCPATGTVTQTAYNGWRTHVRFARAGETIEFVQDGPLPQYRVGDRVKVFYRAQNPHFAWVNTWGALWAFPLFTSVLGTGGLLLDFVNTVRRTKVEQGS